MLIQELIRVFASANNHSWEHKKLNNIAKALGAKGTDNYPSDAFNLIWVQPPPYDDITETRNENCPGLD